MHKGRNPALCGPWLKLFRHNSNTDFEFDGSCGKNIDVKINKINKPHNIQNIPWYMVSMTLLWINDSRCIFLLFYIHDREAYYSNSMI